MAFRPLPVALLWTLACCGAARSDMVVLANRSPGIVAFSIGGSSDQNRAFRLDSGDLLPVRCAAGAGVQVAFMSGETRRDYHLNPNSIYFFYRDTETKHLELHQISLLNYNPTTEAAARKQAAATAAAGGEAPDMVRVTVKVLADDDEKATRAVWEARLRKRIADASLVFEKYAGIRLEVVACDTWQTDNQINDFVASLAEFERKVDPKPADVAIGFASQYTLTKGRTHLGGTRGPLAPHILIREWSRQISEPERLEVLVHELGHRFGAVHSPESNSVMRPVLGDRKSVARNFRIAFDPLNTLAISLLGQEMQERSIRSVSELRPAAKQCLIGVYSTLAKAFPDDSAAGHYLTMLGEPPPAAVRQARKSPPTLVDSARLVLDAVVEAGDENRRLPLAAESEGGNARLTGDELTERYFRAAAQAASALPEPHRVKAFALALAIGLGDSDFLTANSLTRELLPAIESDADRARRLAVLGTPTMLARPDLVRHFCVSAGLAALSSPVIAETAGLLKEFKDAQGTSGFSFADLAADLAGIDLASRLRDSPDRLGELATGFRVVDFMPSVADLREGLKYAEFEQQFGSASDARFKAEMAQLRGRVRDLPADRGSPAEPTQAASPAPR